MSDKYDEAIAYLTKHPEEIYDNWLDPEGTPAGVLFAFVSADEKDKYHCRANIGCLTQIRSERIYNSEIEDYSAAVAFTDELTVAIKADERIPSDPHKITVEDLPVFAEWQRRIDQEREKLHG